ncbi:DUF4286 family protein [Bordetella sp. BOR01]|uniref:DUF4286 family protein n=1 Tax=Bordetella sp. BOR01 TaxID=2854779 RepID=UPI001C442794|nr:DUF4286 family protein [Bordetella sp. BOR01]MBV7484868.1 hypothetical protein [Bordetella sp. BOR01]
MKPGTHSAALVFVWTDIPPADEPAFNDWYNREHVRDRVLAIPGYHWGRRFAAMRSGPKYLALYRTASLSIFEDEHYQALQRRPDDNSRRFIPLFHNTVKGFCALTVECGEAEAAYAALIPLRWRAPDHDALRAWLGQVQLPALLTRESMVAARMAETDHALTSRMGARFLRQGDRTVDALLILEATHPTPLRSAVTAIDLQQLARLGAVPDTRPVIFRQLLAVHPPATRP